MGMFFLLFVLLTGCAPQAKPTELPAGYEVLNSFTRLHDNGDGTKTMEVFSYPIAFLDDTSHYTWIDNAIVETSHEEIRSAGYGYQNKMNDIQTYFPNTLNGSMDIKIIGEDSHMLITPYVKSSGAKLLERQTIYDCQQEVLSVQ